MERSLYDNTKYTDHLEIMNMISLRKTGKIVNEDDVMLWCQQLERGPLADIDNFPTFIEIPLEVSNSRTLKPCNVSRILDVYTIKGSPSSRIPFADNGEYLFFHPTFTGTFVYMDYVGTPVNDDGTPLILRGHELACMAWSLYNLYYADIINDKISVDSKNRLTLEKDTELAAAMCNRMYRNKTRGGSANGSIIKGNMLHRIGNVVLYTQSLPK